MAKQVLVSAREIYYLNNALDKNRSIFGIYRAQCIVEKKESSISETESLISKNLLNDDNSLNENSFKFIKKLEDYHEAKEYININDVLFSVNPFSQYSIYLKNVGNKYLLDKISKIEIVYSLVKMYPFMGVNKEPNSNVNVNKKLEHIDLDKLINEMLVNCKENEWLMVKKASSRKSKTSYIYFYADETTYKYDILEQQLTIVTPKEIRKELFKLFETREVR